jgi:Kef-type K+ transport system membrane component KefB
MSSIEKTHSPQHVTSHYILPSILAGITLSLIFRSHVAWFSSLNSLIEHPFTNGVSHVGFIWLMYIAGLAVRKDTFTTHAQSTYTIATTGLLVPFILTFSVMRYALHYSFKASVLTAISMSVTAEAATAAALQSNHLLHTDTGSTILGAGLIDDLVGLIAYVVFASMYHLEFSLSGIMVPVLAILSFIGGYITKYERFRDSALLKGAAIVFLFLIGYHAHIEYFVRHPDTIGLVVLLCVVAVIGKYVGVMSAFQFVSQSYTSIEKQIIAWGMNSRGIVGIVVILAALQHNMISRKLYTMLLVVSVVTTLLFPIALHFLQKKQPEIR